jgi:hypothetical protein
MTYNPKNANPFQAVNPFNEWTGNNLLLQDIQMRRRAGVTALDSDVSEIFNANSNPQQGGATYGAPLHLSKYASSSVNPYEQELLPAWIEAPLAQHKPAVQQTGGMQMASHYFNNDRRW